MADVFEAMSAHRPYRPSLGLDQTVLNLRGERGKSFESRVVDACLKLVEENKLKLD